MEVFVYVYFALSLYSVVLLCFSLCVLVGCWTDVAVKVFESSPGGG